MERGELRESLAVDEPVETQDSSGDPIIGWAERAVLRGRIRTVRGKERVVANAITGSIDVLITLPWSTFTDRITEKWRLRHLNKGGVVYNIAAPPANVDMRNHEVEIVATTGLNEG